MQQRCQGQGIADAGRERSKARYHVDVLAPVGRPASSSNHDVRSSDFARGLATAVNGKLLDVENRTVRPGTAGFSVDGRRERPPRSGLIALQALDLRGE